MRGRWRTVTPTVVDPNAYTPEFKGFLVKVEKAMEQHGNMSQATLAIKESQAMPEPLPGAGLKRDIEVCKLIDTTTCIGCKACEVACLEWNGYAVQPKRSSTTPTRPCRTRHGITGT